MQKLLHHCNGCGRRLLMQGQRIVIQRLFTKHGSDRHLRRIPESHLRILLPARLQGSDASMKPSVLRHLIFVGSCRLHQHVVSLIEHSPTIVAHTQFIQRGACLLASLQIRQRTCPLSLVIQTFASQTINHVIVTVHLVAQSCQRKSQRSSHPTTFGFISEEYLQRFVETRLLDQQVAPKHTQHIGIL